MRGIPCREHATRVIGLKALVAPSWDGETTNGAFRVLLDAGDDAGAGLRIDSPQVAARASREGDNRLS